MIKTMADNSTVARVRTESIATKSRASQPSITAITPKQYTDAVSHHANQTANTSLFPGSNFENLRLYLQQAFGLKAQRARDSDRSLTATEGFPFLVTYSFNASTGTWGTAHEETDPETVLSSSSSADKPSVLFLRGKPSSKWLSSLGAAWKIDPEFFNRHLDFRSTLGRIDHFSLPSLPSTQTTLFHLPCITLGQIKSPARQTTQSTINAMRAQCTKRMAQYWRTMHEWFDQDDSTGDSIVRGFHLHDQTHFAIEQRVSVVLNKHGGSWQLVVWLDTGKSLSYSPVGAPWLALDDNRQPVVHKKAITYPVIRTRNSVALKSHLHTVEPPGEYHDDLAQSARLLHVDYGRHLDAVTMASDPFYALYDVLDFIAVSYRQYLNMLEDKNRQRTTSSLASIETLSDPTGTSDQVSSGWTLANLHYDQAVLETHVPQLSAALELITHRINAEGPTSSRHAWPQAKDPTQASRAREGAISLQRDYTSLVAQAERLLRLYRDSMTLLMNQAAMAETAKSFAQAKEVTRLSRLAFLFIPLSFTATFMGMNVRELNDWGTNRNPSDTNTQVPIWLWVAVSVPVLIVSFALMLWDTESIFAAINAVRHRLVGHDKSNPDSSASNDTHDTSDNHADHYSRTKAEV